MAMDKTTEALLYLMGCALRNTPPEKIEDLDHEKLYQLSVSHSVVAMVAMALESGGMLTEENTPDGYIQKWKDAKLKAIRKNILLDAEREVILQHFEDQGVWYLPLKGTILKDMYPKMGMRQMADNDILFDVAYQRSLRHFMESRGFQTVEFQQNIHDVYEKPPVYNFEFHTALINPYRHPRWAAYYDNVKDRLVKDSENQYGYHFSDEDFYVFLLIHGYKHYTSKGTGVRFLSDIYVYLREKGSSLNWQYVEAELKTLGIWEFAQTTKDLAMKLFAPEAGAILAEQENQILAYLVGAGTYGTVENWVTGELEKMRKPNGKVTRWTKLRYVWWRLFPDREFMKVYSHFCRKHEWAIPFFRIYRLIKAFANRRNVIRQEIEAVKK